MVLPVLTLAGVVAALSLAHAADAAWNLAGLAEVREDPAQWLIVYSPVAMALPLAWHGA